MAKKIENKKDNEFKGADIKKALENIGTKIPPHSLEAEISVLGSMMIDKNAISKALEIISENSFYNEAHRIIFQTIVKINEENLNIDLISLAEELRARGKLDTVGGIQYIAEINSKIASSIYVENHSRIIQEKFFKRELIKVSAQILDRAYDPATDALDEIDLAERKIFEIAENRLKKSYQDLKSLSFDAFKLIEQLSNRDPRDLNGVPSGLKDLDVFTGGFQKSDLIIIAARPSMGKTALALSMARNAAVVYQKPIAFFSIEMAAIQLMIRLISSEARIDQQKIRIGRINQDDKNEIVKSLSKLSSAKIFIDDSPNLGIMELRAKCRRLKSEHKIEAVFVDYLQLISSPKAESREREISIISSSLKQIAKELDIPVIALAQLNRSIESRSKNDRRPMLSDLRESGSIEQDADVVLFVNRPEQYGQMEYDDGKPTEGTAELIIGKQRNGPTANVRVAFQKNYARFENLTYEYDDSAENIPKNEDIRVDAEFEDDEPF